jgi:hypothetical protein
MAQFMYTFPYSEKTRGTYEVILITRTDIVTLETE